MAEIKPASEKLIDLLEAYGIAVRAGVITPCLQDENQFRKLMGLETAPAEVVADWTETKGVRKPVTLQADNADSNSANNADSSSANNADSNGSSPNSSDDSNSDSDSSSDGFRAKPKTKKGDK